MKLLSPKPLIEFTAGEYHDYIKSLNKPRNTASGKRDQCDLLVRVKRKKDGTLSIITRRNPAYVTEKEIEKISTKTEIAQSELFLGFRERNFLIVRNHKEMESINRETADIPF